MKADRSSDPRPLRVQIEETLTVMMATMRPGDQLPSEPALARQLGVCRATLREVLRVFSERGVLRRRQGGGTFIAARIPTLDAGLEVLESLDRMASRLGLKMEVSHLAVAERDATADELAGLGRSPGEIVQVLAVDRVMMLAGQPVADLCDIVPVTYLRQADLGSDFRGSVLDILLERGSLSLATSRTDISIEAGAMRPSVRLDVQRSAALLKLTSQLYTCDEQVVDYSTGYFVPGYFKFHVIRKVVKK